MVISPDAKTRAFGGVATGIMNAKLAAIVAGTIISSGLIPQPSATAANIGRRIAAEAVLLVISLARAGTEAASSIITQVGRSPRPLTLRPMNSVTPLLLSAAARLRTSAGSVHYTQLMLGGV